MGTGGAGAIGAATRYDPFDAAVIADPYPTYRRLRQEDPVHRLERPGATGGAVWAISRFDDVWQCFGRPGVFSNAGGITASQLVEGRIAPFAALANLDDPAHRVRRAAVKDHFTPAEAARLRDHCTSICDAALEPLRDGDEIDLAVDLGLRLSVAVVGELLGIPSDDRAMVADWVRAIFFRASAERGLSDEGAAAYVALSEYCVALTADGPPPSALAAAYLRLAASEHLDPAELGSHLREVLIGGAETNPKALAAAVVRLAAAPESRAVVADEPGRAAAAFHEAVRVDTPGQFIGRIVTQDVTVADRPLRRGDVALLLIASANRDEHEFADPDRFDIDRPQRRTLGFGHGVHFCIGRHLAALESEVAIQRLLAVAPSYRLDLARATRANHEMVHGYTSLPVRATGGSK